MVGHCGGEGLQKQGVIQVSCNFLRTAVHADSHKRRKVDWGGGGRKDQESIEGSWQCHQHGGSSEAVPAMTGTGWSDVRG